MNSLTILEKIDTAVEIVSQFVTEVLPRAVFALAGIAVAAVIAAGIVSEGLKMLFRVSF